MRLLYVDKSNDYISRNLGPGSGVDNAKFGQPKIKLDSPWTLVLAWEAAGELRAHWSIIIDGEQELSPAGSRDHLELSSCDCFSSGRLIIWAPFCCSMWTPMWLGQHRRPINSASGRVVVFVFGSSRAKTKLNCTSSELVQWIIGRAGELNVVVVVVAAQSKPLHARGVDRLRWPKFIPHAADSRPTMLN